MTTLRERQTYRMAIMKALYDAEERNRPGVNGAELRDSLGVPERDLTAACTYLAEEGLIEVDWTSHSTPATVTLTHEGLRHMEAEEEGRG
ncbi:hypothetical protein [Streptomyces sp. NPDC003023]|uniref:hypothetical protein n=1 Tax=Streptomyces sp. NPDC003023 TaxID=3364675 RepID=UPI0036C9E6D6